MDNYAMVTDMKQFKYSKQRMEYTLTHGTELQPLATRISTPRQKYVFHIN